MAYLVAEDNGGVPQRIPVESQLTIGRHPACEIVLDDGSVSRQHARIFKQGSGYLLEDLNSRNGTFLNNRQIEEETRLLDGDVIKICERSFAFQLHDQASPVASKATTREQSSRPSQSVMLDDLLGPAAPSIMAQMELPSKHDSQATLTNAESRLGALMDITRALANSIGLEQVLPTVLECLFQMFGQADRGFVILDEPDKGLVPICTKLRHQRDDEHIRISRTIVRHVLESQKAVISADAASDSRFDLSQSVTDFRIRSLMCAPLIDAEGNSIGVIQLDTLRNGVGFDNQDLEILATVAMQTGLAIVNSTLHQQKLQQQMIERDLELAHEVQHRLIPNQPPDICGYELFDYYKPADQVGGDYFDYIALQNGKFGIVVADVVGHGVAAALLMAKFSAEVHFALEISQTAAEAMNRLNQMIVGLQLDRFITIVLAVLDPHEHCCSIVNAGHMPPLLRHAAGDVSAVGRESSGLPIGIMLDYEYRQTDLEIKPGDTFCLYTDGISEFANVNEEQFGNQRVLQCISDCADSSPKTVGAALIQDVKQFSLGATQFDDVCLVAFGRKAD